MTRSLLLAIATVAHALWLSGCGGARPALAPNSQRDVIRAFGSEAEILAFIDELRLESRRQYERRQRRERRERREPMVISPPYPVLPPPPPLETSRPAPVQVHPPRNEPVSLEPAPAPAPTGSVPMQVGGQPLAGGPAAGERAAMDEGGIVKLAGDYMVVLHRGRLFTIRVGDGALQPVSVVDAFSPGSDPFRTRYEEILVDRDRIVVIGVDESDERVRFGVFHMAPDGRLAHRTTFTLWGRSELWRINNNRSRGDAVRLVGDRLVHYAPVYVDYDDPLASLVEVRGTDGVVRPAVPSARVYRPAGRVNIVNLQLHSLTSCGLADAEPRCESTALLAPDGTFHVSPTAVYIWTTQRDGWEEGDPSRSVLYRMPLDGSAPTALGVTGDPDPAAFAESADGYVNVLTRMESSGERLFGAEYQSYRPALLRVPLSALGSGRNAATRAHYRVLPTTHAAPFKARIVGDQLIYGTGNGPHGGLRPGTFAAYVVPLAGSGATVIPLPHSVDRIEAVGAGAVVLGADGTDLHLSTLRLSADTAVLADHHTVPSRTFAPALFQRQDGDDSVLLGVPLFGPDRPGFEWMKLRSARIQFLRAQGLRLEQAGELASGDPTPDDGCLTSCVMWYGNARPLFVRGRVLALLGYELVEGREEGGRIRELRRVGFAPDPPTAGVAGEWTFTETVGYERDPHHCNNAGTMRLARAGDSLTVTYRQTGTCTIDGVTAASDGEGAGTGIVRPTGVTLHLGGCEYRGTMYGPDRMRAFVECRLPRRVVGRFEARRAGP